MARAIDERQAPRSGRRGSAPTHRQGRGQVFARKGYRRAGVTDIIRRANVARGTFYLYFASKDAVFLAVVEDFATRLARMLDEPEPPVPLSDHHGRALLQRSLRRWLALFAENRDHSIVVLKEARAVDARFEVGISRLRSLGVSYFTARFRRLQDRGLISDGVPPDLMAHLQMGMIDELVNVYV